jgi:alanine racemase
MSKPAGRTEADIDAAFASDKAACGILTVDLAALTANWRDCAARAKPAECSAVVKADAYGTGLEPVAAALAKAGC